MHVLQKVIYRLIQPIFPMEVFLLPMHFLIAILLDFANVICGTGEVTFKNAIFTKGL